MRRRTEDLGAVTFSIKSPCREQRVIRKELSCRGTGGGHLGSEGKRSVKSDSSVGCTAWNPTEETSPENRTSLELLI